MSTQLPILIVGAGPVGLVSAVSLLKSGVPVRIIEKRETFHGGIRGTALQPRTLEALSFIGVARDVLDISTPPLDLKMYEADGRTAKITPWSHGPGTSQHFPFPEARTVSQAEFEALLRKHLAALGAHVETGKELAALDQSGDSVQVRILDVATGREEAAAFAFVVGADGAKGRIRKTIGIPFLGETREDERILSGNAYVTGLDKENWHMWGNLRKAGFGLKPMKTSNLFQLQTLGQELTGELPTDLEGVRKLFLSISHREDIVIEKVEWVSEWRANIRMCQKFSEKNVFLTGDAAHCHSPFGGQGMNSGIQDAINLSWKLAAVYHGHASRQLLETYSEERVPVIAEMLNLSSKIHNLAFGKPTKSALNGAIGGESAAEEKEITNEEVMRRPKALLQLGVNYRWSPIVLETRADASTESKHDPYGEETAKLRAGDRAPDAPVTVLAPAAPPQDSTLHTLLDMQRHVVMVFASSLAPLAQLPEELERLRGVVDAGIAKVAVVLPQGADASAAGSAGTQVQLLVDRDADARRVYDLDAADTGLTYVVVRPDGVVGAFAADASGARRYFEVLQAGGRR
ncbi:FAD-dependent oxidoreductase [Phanerochaete sordida]|uniref:FAD-dependent oxidoreductase n=1 Tax=Phanerochaete sordida TaxID=48140 RepID=A0A9P3FY74_9APHY|nr:FAD-dependent oxidoreductase [Phanerochaete sordida]